jgi:hypothetical protein
VIARRPSPPARHDDGLGAVLAGGVTGYAVRNAPSPTLWYLGILIVAAVGLWLGRRRVSGSFAIFAAVFGGVALFGLVLMAMLLFVLMLLAMGQSSRSSGPGGSASDGSWSLFGAGTSTTSFGSSGSSSGGGGFGGGDAGGSFGGGDSGGGGAGSSY